MIKTTVSIFIFIGLGASLTLAAEPSPSHAKSKTKQSSKSKKTESSTTTNATSATATSGWTVSNGVWVHSDGYKFVNGQVIRSSPQTHKPAPKPPTQADINAAAKKKNGPKTPAEIAAEKAAERERNLTPRPAPQTGSHL